MVLISLFPIRQYSLEWENIRCSIVMRFTDPFRDTMRFILPPLGPSPYYVYQVIKILSYCQHIYPLWIEMENHFNILQANVC